MQATRERKTSVHSQNTRNLQLNRLEAAFQTFIFRKQNSLMKYIQLKIYLNTCGALGCAGGTAYPPPPPFPPDDDDGGGGGRFSSLTVGC